MLAIFACGSATSELISPEMKYVRAVGLEQLGQRRALDREQLEDQQRRDRARVGVVEVVEVVVAGDLAAEHAPSSRMRRLEEGVADAVDVRACRPRAATVSGTARDARTS